MSDYPDSSDITAIENWKPPSEWSGTAPWLPLLELVEDAWNKDMGAVRPEPGGGTAFITGGWSGNEEIICALQINSIAWCMLWLSSHRGGKYVFGDKP